MSLQLNLRQLEAKSLRLQGEISGADLGLDGLDELIQIPHPLVYDLEVQILDDAVLVQGSLHIKLQCECVRCLKPFLHQLALETWACHLPLAGEDKVEVINDSVDLTPHIREDTVLAFPQHPLCKPECGGLTVSPKKGKKSSANATTATSTWAVLDQLKLKE